MIGEDLDEHFLVLRLQQRVDGARGKLVESVIGRREDCEGARRVEGVNQTGGLDGGDQRGVDRRVDRVPPTMGSFISPICAVAATVVSAIAPNARAAKKVFFMFFFPFKVLEILSCCERSLPTTSPAVDWIAGNVHKCCSAGTGRWNCAASNKEAEVCSRSKAG
jgi:hypothetical protein